MFQEDCGVKMASHLIERKNRHVHAARHDDVIGRAASGREAVERQQLLIPSRHIRAAKLIRLMKNRAAPKSVGRARIKPVALDEKKLQRAG